MSILDESAGLTVTPYTFRPRSTGRFANVRAEMSHFLYTLGVDAVSTGNPDEFPQAKTKSAGGHAYR